jgi:hypothetical protein
VPLWQKYKVLKFKMQSKKYIRWSLYLLVLLAFLLVSVLIALSIGELNIGLAEVLRMIFLG